MTASSYKNDEELQKFQMSQKRFKELKKKNSLEQEQSLGNRVYSFAKDKPELALEPN